MKANGQLGGSGPYPTATSLQSPVNTRRGATAIVIAIIGKTVSLPRSAWMTGGHVLLSGSGHPHLTTAQRKERASTVSSGSFPAVAECDPNPLGTVPSAIPLLVRESPSRSSPGPRVDCLHRLLRRKPWTQVPPDCYSLDQSRGILPTLIEVTFGLHSPRYCFKTVVAGGESLLASLLDL